MENGDASKEDDRSPLAIGYAWAARVMAIGFEVVLPILLGVWIDYLLGTVVLFMFLGLLLGGFVGFTQLLKIVRELNR